MQTLQDITATDLESLIEAELLRAIAKAGSGISSRTPSAPYRTTFALTHDNSDWRTELTVLSDAYGSDRNRLEIRVGKIAWDDGFDEKVGPSTDAPNNTPRSRGTKCNACQGTGTKTHDPDGIPNHGVCPKCGGSGYTPEHNPYFAITHDGQVPIDVLRASIRGVLRYQRLEALSDHADTVDPIDMDGSEPDEDRDEATEASGLTLTPITDPAELERIHAGIADGTIRPVDFLEAISEPIPTVDPYPAAGR